MQDLNFVNYDDPLPATSLLQLQASNTRSSMERININKSYQRNPILAKYAHDYGNNSSFNTSEHDLPELGSTQQF